MADGNGKSIFKKPGFWVIVILVLAGIVTFFLWWRKKQKNKKALQTTPPVNVPANMPGAGGVAMAPAPMTMPVMNNASLSNSATSTPIPPGGAAAAPNTTSIPPVLSPNSFTGSPVPPTVAPFNGGIAPSSGGGLQLVSNARNANVGAAAVANKAAMANRMGSAVLPNAAPGVNSSMMQMTAN